VQQQLDNSRAILEEFVETRFPYPMAIQAGIAASIATATTVSFSLAAGPVQLLSTSLIAGVILVSFLAFRKRAAKAGFLPLAGALRPAVGPLVAMPALLTIGVTTHAAALSWRHLFLICAISATGMVVLARCDLSIDRSGTTRLAVVGNAQAADALRDQLARLPAGTFTMLGYIDDGSAGPDADGDDPRLGDREHLADVVAAHGVDVLVMSSEGARRVTYEALAENYLTLNVRVVEVGAFIEEAFGLVAVNLIESSWLQHVIHAPHRYAGRIAKRVFDIAVSIMAAVPAIPVILVLAALIKLDGGPVFYRQERVGQRGQRFQIVKLRSMCPATDGAGECWSAQDDPRVSRVGRLMRRTHLDELPQIINVLRGDMSIVGPRPEQPSLVRRLESSIPFYGVRHLAKPGITGWAQVRCGYAGSDAGAVLKTSCDLYYVKNRSFGLDCLILFETLRTLVFDQQWQGTTRQPAFAAPQKNVAARPSAGVLPAQRSGLSEQVSI
jgi:exopolysaccharide biosynthesis polyprenyl glycosylphosphotransferase